MKKKSKLPNYVELAMIKINSGIFDDIESVTDIIVNQLNRVAKTTNKRIGKWHESIKEYWRRVFVTWCDCIQACKSMNSKDKKAYFNFLNTRISKDEQRKSY